MCFFSQIGPGPSETRTGATRAARWPKKHMQKKTPERKQREKHGIAIGRGRAGDLRSGRGAAGARTAKTA